MTAIIVVSFIVSVIVRLTADCHRDPFTKAVSVSVPKSGL